MTGDYWVGTGNADAVIAVHKERDREVRELREQRDALLEACKLLVKAHSMSGGYMDGEALLMLNDATIAAQAAIAKAEGR